MNEIIFNPTPMAILATGLCIPDNKTADSLGFHDCALDASRIPALVRRRTSKATRTAISAATRACSNAGIHHGLPAVFVSVTGEMLVTDKLCRAIARHEYPLSPTLFHNSVHNTAAGYWSMTTGSRAPMQAMAARDDGFALGLLESWCQLQTGTEKVLLVVYEEEMPAHLLPDYQWEACAVSLVLSLPASGLASVSRPLQSSAESSPATKHKFSSRSPAMAGLALLRILLENNSGGHRVEVATGVSPWLAEVVIP